MNTYKFILNKTQDITENILQFNYTENLKDVASSFDFTAFNISEYLKENKTHTIDVEDANTGENAYHGYILDTEQTKAHDLLKYSGFDAGFYLNNNQIVKQARGAEIGKFIVEICNENDINLKTKIVNGEVVKDIPFFTSRITKMYKGEILGDVLKELIQYEKDNGSLKDVYIDCKHGFLTFPQYTPETDLQTIIANNITVDSSKTLTNMLVKHSISELKTRVAYTTNDDKDESKKFFPQDAKKDEHCKKYGVLTVVEKIDSLNATDLEKTANDKLIELRREKEHIELSLMGTYKYQKGKYISLDIPEYKIKGDYLITDISHKITQAKEVVSMTFDRYIKL